MPCAVMLPGCPFLLRVSRHQTNKSRGAAALLGALACIPHILHIAAHALRVAGGASMRCDSDRLCALAIFGKGRQLGGLPCVFCCNLAAALAAVLLRFCGMPWAPPRRTRVAAKSGGWLCLPQLPPFCVMRVRCSWLGATYICAARGGPARAAVLCTLHFPISIPRRGC